MSSSAVLSKVPAVTLTFWIIKILATTLGETGTDKLTVETASETTVSGMSFKVPAMKREVAKTIEVDSKMAEAATPRLWYLAPQSELSGYLTVLRSK